MPERTFDHLIVGGGVIGLSLAWQLAAAGQRVAVMDRAALGREASWAGAGILPPANLERAVHPYDRLRGLSMHLHGAWAAELRERTGVDTGFHVCGGLYVARSAGEAAALRGLLATCEDEGIRAERVAGERLVEIEPALREAVDEGRLRAGYWLPEEAQLRNPWHVRALAAMCERYGVQLLADTEALGFKQDGETLRGVRTSRGALVAGSICICSGAWTQQLLRQLNVTTGILPIRGQMVQFRCPAPPFTRIINEGNRYLVPRTDGYVLAGATEEEVGFCKETTIEAQTELIDFARSLVPALRTASIEQSWAGLRPATFDGFPYLGRLPNTRNGFIAAGHFRSGIYLSPATAVVMSELMLGQQPCIDLGPFSVLRA